MELRDVILALQSGDQTLQQKGIKALFHYNDPLTDKENEALTEYNKTVLEQLEGGLKVDEAPAEIEALTCRPVKAFHPLMVVQCVMGISKSPALPPSLQNTLQKRLLPHVAAKTPLTAVEWCAALHIAMNTLPIQSTPASLRCLETLVELAAPVIFFPERPALSMRHNKKVPRKESQTPKLKELSEEEAKLLLLRAMAKAIQTYADQHATIAKHSEKAYDEVHGREAFLQSAALKRLRAAVAMPATADAPELVAVLAAAKKLAPLETVALCVVWPQVFTVAKDQLAASIKASPGAIYHLTGAARCGRGCLRLEKPEETVQFCLYNMGLTTTNTKEAFCDLLAILSAAAPTDATAAYFATRGKDPFGQLFTPFINNAKVLTPAVALELAPAFGELFRRMCDGCATAEARSAIYTGFLQACAFVVTTRCRSAQEKGSVLSLMCAMLATVPAAQRQGEGRDAGVSAAQDEVLTMLRREVAIPAVESAQQALRFTVLLNLEEEAKAGLAGAVKASRSDSVLRRALLVHLVPAQTPQDVIDELVTGLMEECEEIEVVRPDAFLALFFLVKTNPAVVAQRCELLSTADVLSQLGHPSGDKAAVMEEAVKAAARRYELSRAADVAIALAEAGHYAPLTMLLTHASGQLRSSLTTYVRAATKDAPAVATALWKSMTAHVFGLKSEAKPRILSETAVYSLLPIGTALLEQLAAAATTADGAGSMGQTLAEVLLCSGHDHLQGEDPYFYLPNSSPHRRYNPRLQRVQSHIVEHLFRGAGSPLVKQHAEAIVAVVLEDITSMHSHLSIAACRALTLLLTRCKSATAEGVFTQILAKLKVSEAYFMELDPKDRAIAAENAEVMDAFEKETMKELQLLKTYPDRPPKGTSEDDFMDMKKRDAMALAKGLETLRADVSKRTKAVLPTVRTHKAIFLAVRLMGTNGHFDEEGVALLYPYLQGVLNQGSEKVPPVLAVLALDAIVGLLSRTALHSVVEGMATMVARLHAEPTLAVKDVSQVSAITLAIRQSLTRMLPAPFFVVLTPFAWVAFKAGRGGNAMSTTIPVATQHQLIGVLLQNLGQANLPAPTEAMRLLTFILRSFTTLYKTIQQGLVTLMALIPAEHLATIEGGFFAEADSVREVAAAAYSRFQHFKDCRRALVLAYVFSKDSSPNVSKHCRAIITDEKFAFALAPSDWADLTYFLKTYGALRVNAERIANAMRDLFSECKDEKQQAQWFDDIIAVGGLASVVAAQTLSATYVGEVFAKAIDYLCSLTERLDTSEALMRSILAAGRVVLKDTDLGTLKRIAPDLQARLAKPPKDATAAHKEQYLATSTVWLTIISCRLQETELLEAIIEQQNRVLNNSNSAMVHRCVCDAMIEITKNDAIRRSPKLDEFVEKCVKQVIHSGSYIKKKAHAWGLVGVLQGLGLASIRRYNIVEVLEKAGHEKQTEKSGAMVMLEVLCDVMGTKFEPYALAMSQILLESVADPDPKISECADDASRVMMSSLSGVGLRQLIPKLVDGLTAEQAKKRVPPLNFISYVAFCSPKQLAAALPEIMKHVIACLFDVNSSVAAAAYSALRRVAGVVSNPEIQEHVEIILNALRSPSTDTEGALDALLYTRFINIVDPASLALIIPVISRGLGGQSSHTRPKAAQIVASMVNLVGDPKTLVPYAEDLVHLLEEASQDPLAESRTTSAKALGALAAAVGGSLIDDITNWSFGILQKIHSGAIEKAGAAQVFVELVSNCGDAVLQANFAAIEAGMTDEKPPVREAYLYIMVYAPSTLSAESFQNLLPIAFPWVLEGLSHFSDKVRDVALVAGDSIISLYGTKNLTLVLEPLLDGVVSEVSTLRQSSLLLSSKLLLHLVAHIKKKMRIQAAMETVAEEDRAALATAIGAEEGGVASAGLTGEGEDGGLTMEAARDVEKRGVSILGSLEEMLGTDHFVRLLSAIYCGRNEHHITVRNDTNMAWQACVASIRAAVSKIFDSLVRLLMHFASSNNNDCEEVAQKTIEFTCRMQETIERFVNSFCEAYKEDGRRVKLGALNCLSAVVQYSDSIRLKSLAGQLVGCVLPGMQEKDEDVQEAARVVFGRISKQMGSRLIEDAVEAQVDTSVRGVVEVVKVKPTVALTLVFQRLASRKTYTTHDLDLIDAILDVEEAEDELRKYHEEIIRLLLAFLVEGLDGASEVMVKYIEMMPREFEGIPVEHFQKALNVPAKRHGALLAAEAFALGTPTDNIEGITAAFRAIISTLGDDNEALRADAVRIVPELLNSLESRVVDELDDEAREDVTVSKRASGRYQLQYLDVFKDTIAATARAYISTDTPEFLVLGEGDPRLFDALMAFYNRGLDYGTPQQKVEAVECIQDVMAFAPRAISAAAANTVAGRCSKVLFTRNEGSVVLALVQLCLQLMNYPASGKEKMVEGTMALAMFNAALCDSGAARVLALRIVVQLLQRSEKYADLILGTVVTKKAAVDSPLLKTVMCRFVSVVMRYANYEKAFPHIGKLLDIILPIWEAAETPAQAAAAGVALGALCKSASVSDEKLGDIKERTLAITSTKGMQALAGYALVYSLTIAAPGRTDQSFLEVAAEHLSAAASFGASDKMTTLWLLRAAAAVASTGCVPEKTFKVDAYIPMLRRVNATDEQLLSTAHFFFDCVTGAYPNTYATLEALPRDTSSNWNAVGKFDADLDDEVEADSVY